MKPKSSMLRRGVTIVEGLVASGVLVTGLVGIFAMLIKGAAISGDSGKALRASSIANRQLSRLTRAGYTGLSEIIAKAPGPPASSPSLYLDQYDQSGAPVANGFFMVDAGVELVGGALSANDFGTIRVVSYVEYFDSSRRLRSLALTAIVSGKPDAGE